jgi:hypothetical protein
VRIIIELEDQTTPARITSNQGPAVGLAVGQARNAGSARGASGTIVGGPVRAAANDGGSAPSGAGGAIRAARGTSAVDAGPAPRRKHQSKK